MPLPGPTLIPPIGPQTDPEQARVAVVVGGQLASAPARGIGLTETELSFIQGGSGGGGSVPPATLPPLMDGIAAVGTTLKYAREDHRHPTDTSREPTIASGTTSQYWRGDKTWQTLTTGGGMATVSVGDTPPVSPAANALWYETDSGSLYIFWDDGSGTPSAQWIQIVGASGSPDTAANVLAKLLTVGGSGSLLDADLLDGQDGIYYLAWANFTGKPSTFPPTLPIAESDVTNLVTDLGLKAPLASPALTGTPIAPTATAGTSTTQIASTAFVGAAVAAAAVPPPATVNPLMDGTAAVGTTTKYAREDHKHPIDTSREPTITAGTTSQYYRGDKAWTTLDKAAVGLGSVDNTSDASKPVSTATQTALNLKADLASPTLTGTPAAPTATTGTSTTQIATTAFVATAISGSGGASITAADTPPGSPSANALWYETDSGRLFIYTASVWVQVT